MQETNKMKQQIQDHLDKSHPAHFGKVLKMMSTADFTATWI